MRGRSIVFRRAASVILSIALVAPAVLSFPAEANAAIGTNDKETVKSTAYNVTGQDVHYYSDALFRGDSMPYNKSLAALSFLVCNISYTPRSTTPKDQTRSLREFMLDNGFTDFEANEDYSSEATVESSAVACAHKKITDNGKTYTLLAVIPRSGTFGAEFERSLYLSKNANDTGDHAGYDACKDKVVDFVRAYIKKYGIKGDLKVWTTGYSGGGGISNLFSAELIRYPSYVLGNPNFKASNLYDYNFSPMRAAAVESDPKNSKYNCIHNVLDDADLLMKLPTSDRFDRYGKDYRFREFVSKDKAVAMMRLNNPTRAERYLAQYDPDIFMTYKPDAEELIKSGKLVTIEDPDSYLAVDGDPDQAVYLDGVEDEIAKVCALAGDGNSRKGFYKEYQKPMMTLVGFFFKDGINLEGVNILMNAFTKTKTSIPFMLSMYTTFLVDKSISEKNEDFDSLIEQSFNRLASEVENEDGSLKDRYKDFTAYKYIIGTFFTKNSNSADGKYRLKKKFSAYEKNLLLSNLKKLTGSLYAASFGEALRTAGEDEATISKLTSKENSEACASFLMHLVFGNGRQSKKIEPIKVDNEQFCQAATFVGNTDRYTTMHMYYFLIDWYRAADPHFDDYSKTTDAQKAGYRRVFVTPASGASVSGTVKNGSGRTVATFKDGSLKSRSDEWIGMTTSDSGSWLRLPIDQSYKVEMKVSKTSNLDLRIADYSIKDGSEVKTSKTRSWKVQSAKTTDTITLTVPAVKESGGSYDMAGTEYTLNAGKAKVTAVQDSSNKPEETVAPSDDQKPDQNGNTQSGNNGTSGSGSSGSSQSLLKSIVQKGVSLVRSLSSLLKSKLGR